MNNSAQSDRSDACLSQRNSGFILTTGPTKMIKTQKVFLPSLNFFLDVPVVNPTDYILQKSIESLLYSIGVNN